ncbi:MAG: recombinase family protein [Sphingobium sp.]
MARARQKCGSAAVGDRGGARRLRCAIYTRKSTEEGLEQAFNSLDAQYEACAAYIVSQRHEGWTQTSERYDDGGFSGGTMERPGLKRLLADVASGKVDVIVVYKVDRLTRALSDFAKIVEILDARGASFVSVTQAFNTTTSMGRLTLNVLLSFAQFEREVTGERIRDKIAASKKKGMWMGGPVPLGYAVQDRALVIAPDDAPTVIHIFERYLALGSGAALIEALREDGYRTRVRMHGDKARGGIPFGRGMLFHILSNPIYIGKVVHHEETHEGEHEAIINMELWDRVQARIAAHRVEQKQRGGRGHSSPLAGLLRDSHGRRMSPSHASKGKRRYRYYITHSSELRSDGPPSWRLPAADIEVAVTDRVIQLLKNAAAIRAILQPDITAQQLSQAIDTALATANRLALPYGKRVTLPSLLQHVQSGEEQLVITLHREALARTLGQPVIDDPDSFILTAQATKVRAGQATKLVIGSTVPANTQRDDRLVALLVEAQEARAAVLAAPATDIKALARQRNQCRHRLAKLVRLSWVLPRIVTMIMAGGQPASLTPIGLLNFALPLCWAQQEAMLLSG